MRTAVTTIQLTGWLLAGWLVLLPCGCQQDKKVDPKREDHEAAHTARYHPGIHRRSANTKSSNTSMRPTDEDVVQAEELSFNNGPAGCPVLFVNDESITVQEVLEPMRHDLIKQAELLPPKQYMYYLFDRARKMLDMQIGRLLVYQEAKRELPEQAMTMIDKEVDRQVEKLIHDRFDGVEARFEAYLRDIGMTRKQRREMIKRRVTVMKYTGDRFEPMLSDPPRRELLQYYRHNKDEFSTQAEAELYLIEIPFEKLLDQSLEQATDEQLAKARRQARQRLERAKEELHSGVEFAEVAKEYSLGVRRHQGGNWGMIKPGSLAGRWADVEKVLFGLKQGQVSDICETTESMFIAKCGDKTEANTLSFEQAQRQIKSKLKSREYQKLTSDYIQRLLRKATMSNEQRRQFFFALAAAAPKPADTSQEHRKK
jgi:hypothetical protein